MYESKYVVIQGDCRDVMKQFSKNSVDLIFADPPFNIGKTYRSGINDSLKYEDYLKFMFEWLQGASELLKDTGQIVIHNQPRNSIYTAMYLEKLGLYYQNWIALKFPTWPNPYGLNKVHYVILRYSKSKRGTVNRKADLAPHGKCRHCDGLVADWGGKSKLMNPEGKNLSDIWDDIQKVRHKKHKNRVGNELPIRLLERVVKLFSNSGDVILDPFAGTGVTGLACKELGRKFIGIELSAEDCMLMRERLNISD
jgi:site-specific DNA-methyltransferase (adenine-specific)